VAMGGSFGAGFAGGAIGGALSAAASYRSEPSSAKSSTDGTDANGGYEAKKVSQEEFDAQKSALARTMHEVSDFDAHRGEYRHGGA
jgi:hypothetical protein